MPRWDWTTAAGPPGSRASAAPDQASPDQVVPPPPIGDEPISFGRHIKPLFRRMDRESMRFAFDLWEIDDVRSHAQAILARLRRGVMPCDGAWPPENVERFSQWIASGAAD
jgi:hypothetical protein